jgi:hypothetical protein
LVGRTHTKDDLTDDWIRFEKQFPAAKLLRIMGLYSDWDWESILHKLNLAEEVRSWIMGKAEICRLAFEKDFRIIDSFLDRARYGYLNRCTDLECGVYSKLPDNPLLDARFTFGNQKIQSVDDPSEFLALAAGIAEAIKDLIGSHSKNLKREEKSRLKKIFNEIKGTVCLAQSHLNNASNSGVGN